MNQKLLKLFIPIKKTIKIIIKIFLDPVFKLKVFFLSITNRHNRCGISDSTYKQVCKLYKKCLKNNIKYSLLFRKVKAFITTNFTLISDNLTDSDDGTSPIVFVIVKNELDRMKVFFAHYRKLGIKNFIVLDNDSNDGTLEFLCQQSGTKVYQILEPFQTQKKEGWIEKILVMNCINRWCIIVDSDELLDFLGSENHSIAEMIQTAQTQGAKRIWGYMIDMYSKGHLFNSDNNNESFIGHLKYFDKDSYLYNTSEINKSKIISHVYGGPRYRVFNKILTLSKQSIFYFDANVLYKNCHELFPAISLEKLPCWYILRHYKFLSSDKAEYQRRIQNGNFYNNSIEYKVILDQINQNKEITFYHENSVEYVDSNSLKDLPFLEQIPWQNS